MPAHILIVDGVPRESQELLVANGGRPQGANYAEALASQAKATVGDIVPHVMSAADGGDLPPGMALTDFDGITWTGSPLNTYNDTPLIQRKIAFAREAFQSGVPCFGSCWGLQVVAVALGGRVHKNPRGPQLGFARAIMLTDAGRHHPMYFGKHPIFDAICVHQDEVCEVPAGAVVLAGNRQCDIQAMAIEEGERSFWGVQYHPEFDLFQIAAMFKRSAHRYVERGLARCEADMHAFADELRALHDDPARKDIAWRLSVTSDILDTDRHRREFANWLRVKVAPRVAGRTARRVR